MNTADWLAEVEARIEGARSPRSLTVLFDPGCALCRRCRDWMLGQPSYVAVRFVPCTGEEARARFGAIPWLGDELVVVGDGGEVWAGAAAFLTCLWALPAWRPWSYRLAGPAFAPLAGRFFHLLSSRRRALAALVDHRCAGGVCHRGHT